MKPIYFLYIYILVMSVLSFFSMGIDKVRARKGYFRTPEKTLFILAALGGGIGGTLGMFRFRHKTKHWYFRVFFPLFAVIQISICVWISLKFAM